MIERVLIYDPVPCKGGSKEVMKTVLTQLTSDISVWVVSNDIESWCGSNVKFVHLYCPLFLLKQNSGPGYFLKHFIFLVSLFITLCKLKRFTKIIGLSGPCVDFALYLLTSIIHIDIIQLVQGDIANSKIASFGLTRASQVFYLPSTFDSIVRTLKRHSQKHHITERNFRPFINGIDSSTIKQRVFNEKVGFLWAASLSRWKKVELFVEAMTKLNCHPKDKGKFFASICYIKPQIDAYIEPDNFEKSDNIQWYANPKNLNEIRANSSVFVSTAEHEPFGLSILEAMTAGLAIVIPADGSYWDQQLTAGYNCVKYRPDDIKSLVNVLNQLINDPKLLLKIAKQAKHFSQDYGYVDCYSRILKCIPN